VARKLSVRRASVGSGRRSKRLGVRVSALPRGKGVGGGRKGKAGAKVY